MCRLIPPGTRECRLQGSLSQTAPRDDGIPRDETTAHVASRAARHSGTSEGCSGEVYVSATALILKACGFLGGVGSICAKYSLTRLLLL